MSNSDMPAMPQPLVSTIDGNTFDTQEYGSGNGGLTKREHFAGLAMIAFIAKFSDKETIKNKSYELADLMCEKSEKETK